MLQDNPDLYNRSILNGKRWNAQANQTYVMPANEFHANFDSHNPAMVANVVQKFVERHSTIDAPRIAKLQRYYLGDNDIHYWRNDKRMKNRADNRIASGFAKFITNMRVGYMLGKPIQFKYNNDLNDDVDPKVDNDLKEFNRKNDEQYHEKVMKTNLSVTGRAYELLYSGEAEEDENGNVATPDIKMRAIDPATAFVVYDTSIDQHSLFGVRYYVVNYDNQNQYYIDVYTADTTYHFESSTTSESPNGDYTLLSSESTSFGAVPLTEFINNEDRTGDWEAKLDEIDAYDLAMSEMANSEEDFANAKLMINGDFDFSNNMTEIKNPDGTPVTDKEGNPIKVPKVDTRDPFLWLKPSFHDNANGTTVVPSSAQYLTKQLNEQGWQTYINQLITDIHKDTNTPNTTDDAFSGQSSGVALMYKLFGEDQERSMQESLYTRGLMRRLRLLGNFWKYNSEISDPSVMDNYTPDYTPNLPRNNADIVNIAVQLNSTGLLSDQTLREYLATVTGVSADAEEQRLEDEQEQDPNQNTTPFDGGLLQGVNSADLYEAKKQAAEKLTEQGQSKPMNPVDFVSSLQQRRGDNNAK
ncbi:phage portal protein [Lactobacillus reuteri]|uniref:phage portal protein n=1 Tax=Limosilactobacillus reuteri TaxID=1598 RepID=UPI00146D52AC|nr:phage portal protein [Limosilactobacillus reuteri]NMV48474.1 phage portal protein [Limosilactobacillus reuteri]NMV50222.1 phage portal protein [Limosilactobacillus reuteri]NMV59697.1 phage portal protein [Limosilactobacillus reuteri]NMV63257.1 phage portal protein [Limosilactobacillus reuteri]NMV66866.1 phage portal protein [Limosilactobacillus reuteri]